ncbi:MAG TPA: phosphate ABC transporter substrate-binding protein [Roseibacterium sp.]|nr:phosphate ABC transporter substrate-binding protein [Roseibacterium sp.]
MIASLPMYLRDETRAANEALWALIRDALRDHGINAPDNLDHDAPVIDTWRRPDLVFGQICSLPYRAGFAGDLTLIGSGDYGLSGIKPGTYFSVFLARKDDPRDTPAHFADARFAYNEPGSHSGWCAPWSFARDHGFAFTNAHQTGSHRASAQGVADHTADLCSIDAVTWALIARYDAFAPDLRVIAHSAASPGLCFVTAPGNDPMPYRAALSQAIDTLPEPHKSTLLLRGVVPFPESTYTALPLPDPPSMRANAAKTERKSALS